jgi:hypothetical protein
VCAAGIDVDFLKDQDIRIGIRQKIYDRRQPQAAVDVPIHDP